MTDITKERNISFLPGELGGSERCGAATYSSSGLDPTFFARKDQLERREFLPGEIGVLTVRACQPTTIPDTPHFFTTDSNSFLPGELGVPIGFPSS